MVRRMHRDDYAWAATLMERRRDLYATFSPVFWRPAQGVAESHARFLRETAERDGAVALRTSQGFALSVPHEGRCFVDDFAVERDDLWPTEGQELLLALWAAARSIEQPTLRVVTARNDTPKRDLLASVGLAVTERWWVRELQPTGPASAWGPVALGDVDGLFMPAPPVYDPGGPVCFLDDVEAHHAIPAAEDAARLGAVLAIVRRHQVTSHVPDAEPALEAAGFHNPSEFYEGAP